MKIRVGFKTPDAMHYALADEFETGNIEDEDIRFDEKALARQTLEKYIRYGEYVTIEFDTETGEAKVLPL